MIQTKVIQGDSIVIQVQLKNKSTGLPIDFTGATGKSAIVDASNKELYFTDNIFESLLDGKIKIIVPNTVTKNLQVNSRIYGDIEITYPTGITKTYAQTTYIIEKGFTNR